MELGIPPLCEIAVFGKFFGRQHPVQGQLSSYFHILELYAPSPLLQPTVDIAPEQPPLRNVNPLAPPISLQHTSKSPLPTLKYLHRMVLYQRSTVLGDHALRRVGGCIFVHRSDKDDPRGMMDEVWRLVGESGMQDVLVTKNGDKALWGARHPARIPIGVLLTNDGDASAARVDETCAALDILNWPHVHAYREALRSDIEMLLDAMGLGVDSFPRPLHAWYSAFRGDPRTTAIAARTSSPVQWNWTEWPVEHHGGSEMAPMTSMPVANYANAPPCPKDTGPSSMFAPRRASPLPPPDALADIVAGPTTRPKIASASPPPSPSVTTYHHPSSAQGPPTSNPAPKLSSRASTPALDSESVGYSLAPAPAPVQQDVQIISGPVLGSSVPGQRPPVPVPMHDMSGSARHPASVYPTLPRDAGKWYAAYGEEPSPPPSPGAAGKGKGKGKAKKAQAGAKSQTQTQAHAHAQGTGAGSAGPSRAGMAEPEEEKGGCCVIM